MRIAPFFGFACLLAAPSALATPAAPADIPAEPAAPPESETLDYDHAFDRRMTLPVVVDGQGPFRFVVDTGAERTVIARELAETLDLAASEDVMLTSVFDVQQVPTVIVPELGFGRRTVNGIQAPALERRNLGAEGVLGIDTLQDQHVMLDFDRQEITIAPSRYVNDRPNDGTIVVRARTRLGRMVVADARIDGTRIHAIVDTGSTVSIGNSALRERLVERGRMDPAQSLEVTAVTGTRMRINFTIAERVRIGGVDLESLPIAFVDSELFRELDLLDRPAMLLGINALRAFDRVSIDFASHQLRLELPSLEDEGNRNFVHAEPEGPLNAIPQLRPVTSLASAGLSMGGEQ